MQINQIINDLTLILEERDSFFPKRDPENTKKCAQKFLEFYDGLKKIDFNFKIDQQLVETALQFSTSQIIICGSMKSGTTLLLELLDNHENIVALPGDSGLVSLYQNKSNFSFKDWEFHWLKRFINPRGQAPFWLLGKDFKTYLNFCYYLNYFYNNLSDSFKKFTAVPLAYFCANPNRPTSPKFWVEKNPNNEFYLNQIKQLYPNAKFINIIRNPLDNCAALKKLGQFTNVNLNIEKIKSNYLTTLNNLKDHNFHVICYENLEQEMKKISDIFEIEFQESLFIPTSNGLKTKPNSMFSKRF